MACSRVTLAVYLILRRLVWMSIQKEKKNLCHIDLRISSPDCRKIFLKSQQIKDWVMYGTEALSLDKANQNFVDK
jgi:hypothetical protein